MLRLLQKTLSQPYSSVLFKRQSFTHPRFILINHTIRMSSSEEPTVESARILFEKIEQKFPSQTLGKERWYLVTVRFPLDSSESPDLMPDQIASLVGGGQPEFAGALYSHIIEQPNYATSEARQALVRRLREALVKSVAIIGVCRPLEAIFNIDAVQRPEDKDYSCSRWDQTLFRRPKILPHWLTFLFHTVRIGSLGRKTIREAWRGLIKSTNTTEPPRSILLPRIKILV